LSRGCGCLSMRTGISARSIYIPRLERPRLSALAAQQQAPFEVVRRARIIQMLACGLGPSEVALALGCTQRNVYKWRARWEQVPAVEALRDARRSGRPSTITMQTRCRVIQLACDRPEQSAPPFRSVWTQQALADALAQTTGERISRSTIQRLLSAEGLRPHKVRAWLHSPDKHFVEKVERICDIYLSPAPKDTVILCIDEKPMQVLGRRFPSTTSPDGSVRQDYEYVRRGVTGDCKILPLGDSITFGLGYAGSYRGRAVPNHRCTARSRRRAAGPGACPCPRRTAPVSQLRDRSS
jgi:transposase